MTTINKLFPDAKLVIHKKPALGKIKKQHVFVKVTDDISDHRTAIRWFNRCRVEIPETWSLIPYSTTHIHEEFSTIPGTKQALKTFGLPKFSTTLVEFITKLIK